MSDFCSLNTTDLIIMKIAGIWCISRATNAYIRYMVCDTLHV